MKTVHLDDMKALTLDGLKYLKLICEKNNITYYLAYGTLLGAIRHKGYIPWDDDIDIWIPRSDYFKLIEALHQDKNDDWEVVSSNVNHDYFFEWAKLSNKKTMITPARFVSGYIYGVSIDLFPLDDVEGAKSEEEVKQLMDKVRRDYFRITSKYRGMTNTVKSIWKHQLYKGIFKFASFVLGPYFKQIEKYNQKLKELGNGTGDYLIGSQTPLPVVFRSEWFKETIEVEFEGEKYPAPAHYEKVLTKLYGDYMQLPPVEKRVTHHLYRVYYKDL